VPEGTQVIGWAFADANDFDVAVDAPVLRGSRVEVTMAKEDGTWLIAGLEPV